MVTIKRYARMCYGNPHHEIQRCNVTQAIRSYDTLDTATNSLAIIKVLNLHIKTSTIKYLQLQLFAWVT